MKTLKQLQKEYGYNNDPILNQMLKEWLERKRQGNLMPYAWAKIALLDELLEELNQ